MDQREINFIFDLVGGRFAHSALIQWERYASPHPIVGIDRTLVEWWSMSRKLRTREIYQHRPDLIEVVKAAKVAAVLERT